ncbi:Gfo/Idh/MocA family oxidoreductase [Photobacterium damselae subsp. damselae]|uniref:Gfo/Idh/MocA family protein n=1 Tax=Photobacterium damselae TaxID=38293 RepID=UPI001F1C99EA|nr:Gfo/Idh/MocA family oxidoreductase [Photobacterium damselae]UJZ95406.1 Gfo/Idh/MocA family oxidoreductase [Photobacterium damselae subsp. damselae]UJZ99579.1 Gfo/Idh/MocA family oxidoreductase [Photobacterium damselae subsp. damselae]UKA11728.1 Gfo/Idh/MocA family oxidoreductase [Photobacterium damselae subsp. damselae]
MYSVGVIGLGQIAYSIDSDPNRTIIWSHIKAYNNTANAKVTCICDTNEDLVNQVKNECNIENGYIDYDSMLNNHKLDIVSICTPISTHVEIIKKCVDSGVKKIFCEKSLSYSLKEAQYIVDYCKEHSVNLIVNHILRWDSFLNEIKDLLDEKLLGDIYIIDCYGTTALHTSSSHLIDLMCFFANSEPLWAFGDKQTDYIRIVHGVEDSGGAGMVKFKNGVIGFIKSIGSSEYNYTFEMDIICQNGRIRIFNNGTRCEVYKFKLTDTSVGSKYKTLHLIKSIDKVEKERMTVAINDIISNEFEDNIRSTGKSSLDTIRIISNILSA